MKCDKNVWPKAKRNHAARSFSFSRNYSQTPKGGLISRVYEAGLSKREAGYRQAKADKK